jgi:phytoene synthase
MSAKVTVQTWEHRLLNLAYEALEDRASARPGHHQGVPHGLLEQAYTYSAAVTHAHSRTFYLASGLLPGGKRAAARALYAFCRISDDIVDQPGEAQGAQLADWRRRALGAHPAGDDPVALAFADARARYAIPRRYAEQLVDGVRRDLTPERYETFDDLAAYCYGVASTVGLMAMHIVGFAAGADERRAIPYAVKLGVALQLTNILRDVGADYAAGRVYLPQAELEDFGLSEADLARGVVTDRWRAFMSFQVARNRQLYREAMPGVALLAPDGRFAIAAAADLYRAILADIEAHDYDVFGRRAHLGALRKLARLPGIWWQAASAAPAAHPVA